jgi:uncharacterized protein
MHLTLHLTQRCNLDCTYCYSKHADTDMTLDIARKAIEQCAQGPNCGIIFFGGEPLLRKDLIWEIMDWCEQTDPGRFHFKVTTNGILLDEAFLYRANSQNLHVALSHDGVRQAHDRFRITPDGQGTFDALQPSLEELLTYQPFASVMITVNPETVHLYAESVQWLQSRGVQYIIASLNHAASWTDITLRLLRKEYQKLEDWYLNNYRQERKCYFSPFDKRIASHIFPNLSNSCQLGKRQISVAPDGKLFPCVQFVGREEYCIGGGASGMDNTRRDTLYHLNEQDKPVCIDCALNSRCHNKCACLNIQTTGDLTTPPALLCEVERMLMPIADRLANRLFKERNALFLHRHYNPAFPILSFLEELST